MFLDKYFFGESEIVLPRRIESPEELIRLCEEDFELRLENVASSVIRDCKDGGVRLISLSGPTCAGKTTAAKKLTVALEAAGYAVHLVSIDDFFYDREYLHDLAKKEGGADELDYDSVRAIDLYCLEECVNALVGKGKASIPIFNFESGNRSSYRELVSHDEKENVYIFEGIQAVYPEVSALFSWVRSRSVFIAPKRSIRIENTLFAPEEIRLMRRIVRDKERRGASPEFTLFLWKGVRANEMSSIFPYAEGCDYFIDSTMGYEIHMLKPYLESALSDIPSESVYFDKAQAMLSCVEGIEKISPSLLPPFSLYYEFIHPLKS